MAGFVVFAAFAAWSGLALGHGQGPHAAAGHWNWLPGQTGWLLFACTFYAVGCWRMQRARNLRKVLGPGRAASFAAGMLTLFLALISPLDALADQLFAAHMTQHLLLMIVAPPLLVSGRPVLVWLWAFPLSRRRDIGRWWNRAGRLRALQGFLMRPLTIWLLASAALWLWHVPRLYDWALSNELVHVVEHLCFFLTSLAFWTLVVEPYDADRPNPGLAIVAVVTFALHSGLLGALLAFAPAPLYRTHNLSFPALSPLEDQQIAGLIMWIPASLVYLAALSLLFVDWLARAGKPLKQRRGSSKPLSAPA